MRRVPCTFVALVALVALAAVAGPARPAHASSDLPPSTFFWGAHWESGSSVGTRMGVHDFDWGYFYADLSLMTMYIASAAGLDPPDGPLHKQARLLSIRGGGGPLLATVSPTSRLTLDIGGDLEVVRVREKGGDGVTKETAETVFPVYAGPALMQAWSDGRLLTLFIPTVGAAMGKSPTDPYTNEQRPGFPATLRVQVDLYFVYYIQPLFLLYGDVGLGYFPNGIPQSDEAFLSPRVAVGFAI